MKGLTQSTVNKMKKKRETDKQNVANLGKVEFTKHSIDFVVYKSSESGIYL